MAIRDPLTGLRNRRWFDEYVRWTLGRRTDTGLAYLLLDIDFFKQFNDRYGHSAGDACLQRIADTLKASLLRAVDVVARYGGEEFVVLLPDTTADGAREVAERIRLRVEALGIPHAGSTIGPIVTLSIGVAHAPHTSRDRCATGSSPRRIARCTRPRFVATRRWSPDRSRRSSLRSRSRRISRT